MEGVVAGFAGTAAGAFVAALLGVGTAYALFPTLFRAYKVRNDTYRKKSQY